MARICLISPGHLSSNPRLVKEADALTGAGHQVVVIHGWSFPPLQAEDRRFLRRPWAEQRRVPFGALASSGRRLWQRLRQRLARGLVRIGVRVPALEIRAWHPAGPELIKAARSVVADLYIAHYPAALPAAAIAARDHGGRYSFDAEDFHLGDFPEGSGYESQRQLLRRIESLYVPTCAFLTAASPGIAQAYAEAYGLPLPLLLRNVFPLAHAPEGPTAKGTAIPGPSVYWFSQTIGPERGLECAIRAIAIAACKPHLYLRGFISAGYCQHLQGLARAEGVEDRLHLLPPAPPEQMARLAAVYDLGLVVETGATLNRRIALTNKLFTYALAGVPALISDIPAHRSYAVEAERAVRVFRSGDPASLATELDRYVQADEPARRASREAAFSLGQHHLNWERESTKLTTLVSNLFA